MSRLDLFHLPIRITHEISGLVSNPQAAYIQRPQIMIMRASEDLTITRIHISTNTASYNVVGDLKFADNATSLANATVIDVCDTTSGMFTATSGFDDATVPSGKYIYFQLDSSPDANVKDLYIEFYYTYDSGY